MDRLQENLGVTAASCALARAMARGGTAKVATKAPPIMEEKIMLTLLPFMVLVVLVVITI